LVKDPSSPPKILAVESHDVDLQLLEKLLPKTTPECEFLSAMQGDLGLELAKEHHPDLIFLDVNLPDLSTADFLSRLLASPSQKNTRVVLLGTDLASPEFLALSRIYEFELLPKPYEPEALFKILKDIQPR
jgi:CheY-like chemotaxis protein